MSNYDDDDLADDLRQELEATKAELAEARAEAQFATARAPKPVDASKLNEAMHAAKSPEELAEVLRDAGLIVDDD